MITHRDDDGADTACDIDLRFAAAVEAGLELSLWKYAFLFAANIDLATVSVTAECEVDAVAGGFAKDDRIVGEEQFHLVGK